MSLIVALTGQVQVTDGLTGSVAMSSSVNQAFTGTVFSYDQTLTIGVGSTTVTLPASPIQFVFIRNLHTTQTLSVTWTKNGGSSQAILTIDPGGFIAFGETTTGNGITALTLSASGASTPASVILAG